MFYFRTFDSEYFGEIVELVQTGQISRNIAKLVLDEIIHGNHKNPLQVMSVITKVN